MTLEAVSMCSTRRSLCSGIHVFGSDDYATAKGDTTRVTFRGKECEMAASPELEAALARLTPKERS
jgi:hypothetical protein